MNTSQRAYRQIARAETTRATARRVVRAAVELWREREFDDVTLKEIADRSGVTVQTLIRRFGSKTGILDCCLEEGASDVSELRDEAPAGDVDAALAVLMQHYERDGQAVLRTLKLEGRSEGADRIVQFGREAHRAWCARVFAPFLPGERDRSYTPRLDAFVGATDIYLWKLWRQDLGRSEAETKAAFGALLGALAAEKNGRTG